MRIRILKTVALLFIFVFINFCKTDSEEQLPSAEFNGINVSTWMYQIQGLENRGDVNALDETDYDLLVVEPGNNLIDEPYETGYIVDQLKNKPDGQKRILLAYIDIGEAEEYRTYWKNNWVAPTATKRGIPDFLVTIDPDGWSGNYPVAYWDAEWQDIWLKEDGIIDKLVAYGFDGVYLDWVEAYDDDKIRDTGENAGINPENEMMLFIDKIRKKGRSVNPEFLIFAQNAPYLIDINKNYYISIIDALAVEDTWFYGEGDADWNDANAGDLSGGERHQDEYSTENRILQSKKYLNLGVPVFTVDYCISAKNAEDTYQNSRENGFIPLVTRVSLSRITETPPF